jgi:DNA-binding response OmpR family regulator
MAYAHAILVIEDDPSSAPLLQEALETDGHLVILPQTRQEGLRVRNSFTERSLRDQGWTECRRQERE